MPADPPEWLAAPSQQNNPAAAQSRRQAASDDDSGVFVFKKKVEDSLFPVKQFFLSGGVQGNLSLLIGIG
jgi:hypothetical protein